MDIRVDQSAVVVFDLDDTLYNEIDYLKSAYREISSHLDREHWKPLYAQMFSLYRNKQDVFSFLTKTYPVQKPDLISLYRNHKPQIEVFSGVIQLMESIKEQGGKIGIITDGRSRTQRNKIEALGIGKYIDGLVISEDIGSEKPDPRNFEALCEQIPARTYFYIADNIRKDFHAPNLMGWTTIGLIDNGLNIHSDGFRYMNQGYLPHGFVQDLNEIRVVN
jgi:putative hydrolase of the HAD superfamily